MQVIWKGVGQTPLQALEQLRERNGIATDIPMTYAGRLDPLAEGKLLILIDEECKQKDKYLGLDKEYEFEILLGTSSDTGDVLGIIKKSAGCNSISLRKLEKTIEKLLQNFTGKYICEYPAFSSKTVRNKDGENKPLFLWALEDRLGEIEIPKKEVQIYKLKLLSCASTMTRKEVSCGALAKISKVLEATNSNSEKSKKKKEDSKKLGNNFRREMVIKSWHEWLESSLNHSPEEGSNSHCTNRAVQKNNAVYDEVKILKFRCLCSSGTYMRTLAQDISKHLGTVGLAWSIKRTKIGRYKKLFNTFSFWIEKY